MAQYTREYIIKKGLDKKVRASDINYALQKYGYKPDYNPLTEVENYKRLPGQLLNNARAMARDFRSLTGYAIKPYTDVEYAYKNAEPGNKLNAAKEAFIKAVNDDKYRKTLKGAVVGGITGAFIPKVGPIGGALTGASLGVAGGPKELADAILSTYNTNLDELIHLKTNPLDVAQGVFQNPLYTALDFAPVYGRGLSKAINKGLEYSPSAIRQMFPDKTTRAFNEQITNSILSAKANSADNYKGFLNLETMPNVNRENLVKNILTNDTSNLTDSERILASEIKNNLRNTEREFLSRGYADANEFRDNARAQYVMYKLGEDNNLLHDDIYRIIRGEELRTGNKLPDKTSISKIKELADEGGRLYDNGDIVWLSQKLAPIRDASGNVIARQLVGDAKDYFDTNRIIGKQSTAKLANVFDATIKEQLDQFNRFIDVEDTIENLVNNFGISKLENGVTSVPINKTAFSTKAFKEYIKKNGANSNLEDALRSAKVVEEGAYLLDNMYLDMINNAFKKAPATGSRRVLNAFKKAVLANPHWIILNRIGNWSNNFMDGVSILDYKDAKLATKLGIVPKQLEHQTSFGSYVHGLEGVDNIQGIPSTISGIGKSMAQPISRLKQAYGKFKDSKKDLSSIGEFSKQVLGNTSDITANPFYKLEAALEYKDRLANMVHQAKLMEKTTGKNWKQILKDAQGDSKLYSELNTKVNNALGDYIGKNYAMPSEYYNTLSEVVPFYRFLTQTARTTGNQLMNSPRGFMTNITIPSRAGYDLSNYYYNKYGLNPKEYQGGAPYLKDDDNIRTIGLEPLPIANVLESFGNIGMGKDLTSLLGPYLSTFPQVLSFRKNGRIASTPRRTEMIMGGDYTEGQNKFQPTLGETLAYGLNTFANTLYHPYRLGNTTVKEIVNAARGKAMQSGYDTNSYRENPLSYTKTLPSEMIGKWFGIQTTSNYRDKGKSNFVRGYDKTMGRKMTRKANRNKAKKER